MKDDTQAPEKQTAALFCLKNQEQSIYLITIIQST